MAELKGVSLDVLHHLQDTGDHKTIHEIAGEMGIKSGAVNAALSNLSRRHLGGRVEVEGRKDKIFVLSNEGRDYAG